MKERERDQALLSVLGQEDRATLEAIVQEFVSAELPTWPTPDMLRHAADMFEDAGVQRPPVEGITGLLVAALLREQAAGSAYGDLRPN